MSKWVVRVTTLYGEDDGIWLLIDAKTADAARGMVSKAWRITGVEPYDPKVHKLTRR